MKKFLVTVEESDGSCVSGADIYIVLSRIKGVIVTVQSYPITEECSASGESIITECLECGRRLR